MRRDDALTIQAFFLDRAHETLHMRVAVGRSGWDLLDRAVNALQKPYSCRKTVQTRRLRLFHPSMGRRDIGCSGGRSGGRCRCRRSDHLQ